MRISTLKYFVVDALKSMKRNKTISIASAATVAATLFILGIFLLTVENVNAGMKEFESKVEVKVYLKKDIKMTDQNAIETRIKGIEGVKEVVFESSKEALDKMKEQLGAENKSLTEGFDKENPLPMSYMVKVEKPIMVETVVETIKDMPGIDVIEDARELVDKLMSFTKTIKWVGLGMFILLMGVSLFLIGNTIKLTLYSRRREIGIMKFIGATDWFIRWPFIIEGMSIGIMGAVLSTTLLYYGYQFVYLKLNEKLILIQLVSPQFVLTYMAGGFLIAGILIGAIGSIIAIRKFLAV